MRFVRPLLRLPIRFDADALANEISRLPRDAWVAHPNAFPGNNAVRLITTDGMPTDALGGRMAPTEYLRACPYMMEMMSELGCTWGRSRLMGLAAGAEVPEHADSHYYWRTHVRIHIPVITNPGVEFTCAGETVHMAAGECWVFDSFQRHEVHNRGNAHRVHLVLDTVGGGKLWDLIEEAQADRTLEPRPFPPGDGSGRPLLFEQVNIPKVMSSWEMRSHIAFIESAAQPHPKLDAVRRRLDKLVFDWEAVWAAHADPQDGLPSFFHVLQQAAQDLSRLDGTRICLSNDLPFYYVLAKLVFEVAVSQPGEASHQMSQKADTFVAPGARLAS
jgi:hypothetical protein